MADANSVQFRVGDRVRVKSGCPPWHFRTPRYIQNHTGRVVSICGIFRNPESLAHGGDGLPAQPLYRVEFDQSEVWEKYSGPSQDKVLVDIYQHWLDGT